MAKRLTVWMAVVFVGVSALAFGQGAADEAAIKAVTKAYETAWNEGDVKGVAALFAPDGTLRLPNGQLAGGTAQLSQMHTQALAEDLKGVKLQITPTSISFLTPGVAVAQGTVAMKSADGKTQNAFYMTTLVKQQGKWVMKNKQVAVPTAIGNAAK